jgi:3',5'-cyclic AMP phosphodiesterase CpdA
MSRIAHITDMHLNGGADRRARFEKALAGAVGGGATYLLLTGDLTAHGSPAGFVELAGCLDFGWPHGATIVGGNHDGPAMKSALGGCLGRFQSTSLPGVPVDLGDSLIIPVDTYYARRALAFRALGSVGKSQLAGIEATARVARRPVVLAMHHGPIAEPLRAFASLNDRQKLAGLLTKYPHLSICCGHDHRILDLGRVHVAASCASHTDPLRLYDIVEGVLQPSYQSGSVGHYRPVL